MIRQYVFEAILDKGLVYKRTWSKMNARQKRGFVNHHLSFLAKIMVLLFAIYPFFAVATGHATFRTRMFGPRWRITMGDALYVAIMIVSVMYAHELSYREGVSYVAVAHHVGVLIMSQLTLYWSTNARHQSDSSLEVVLALFWGKSGTSLHQTHLLTLNRILRFSSRSPIACHHDHVSQSRCCTVNLAQVFLCRILVLNHRHGCRDGHYTRSLWITVVQVDCDDESLDTYPSYDLHCCASLGRKVYVGSVAAREEESQRGG